MKYLTFLIGLFSLVLLCGCGASSDNEQILDFSIIPLAAGNKWIYETTYYDSTGIVLATRTDSSFVGLTRVVNGKTWYYYINQGTLTPEDAFLFRNDSLGLWQFNEDLRIESFTLKYPATAGEIYNLTDDSSFTATRMLVVSTTEAVSTHKGVFICYRYKPIQREPTNTENEVYAAPSVGIIKETETNVVFTTEQSPDPIFGVTKVRLLKDYHLK